MFLFSDAISMFYDINLQVAIKVLVDMLRGYVSEYLSCGDGLPSV